MKNYKKFDCSVCKMPSKQLKGKTFPRNKEDMGRADPQVTAIKYIQTIFKTSWIHRDLSAHSFQNPDGQKFPMQVTQKNTAAPHINAPPGVWAPIATFPWAWAHRSRAACPLPPLCLLPVPAARQDEDAGKERKEKYFSSPWKQTFFFPLLEKKKSYFIHKSFHSLFGNGGSTAKNREYKLPPLHIVSPTTRFYTTTF